MMNSLISRVTVSVAAIALAAVCGATASMAQGFSYAEAAKPYAGTSIRVLDEVTPLQETMATIVPEFTKETGINVQYELLSHLDVINKGQADMLSGSGAYDAVMLHGLQMGPLLAADAILPIDDLLANDKISNPDLDAGDLIQTPFQTLAFHGGKQYGFINWNYNMVYWARADLLNDEGEKQAFQAKYGYPLAPAQTLEQMRDVAEFFTRKAGENLKGQPLVGDFYGIVLEGLKGQTSLSLFVGNILRNFGGDFADEQGKPSFNTPAVVDALKLWAELWKFSPPGTAEYSVIDVPTVMGNGIAAQSIAYSDFVLGIDKPGASPLHGQFIYAPVPVKEGADPAQRAAEGEPSMIVISRASDNPEAAFLFLQWMVDKKQQKALMEAGKGGVPIRTSTWADLSALEETNPTLVSAMKASLEVVKSKRPMPNYFQIVDELSNIVQQVGLGSITPENAAEQGQQALERLCGESCLLPQ
jgi:ABC-type glycerol-3-phosphate transport system substrate-binding protein